MRKYQIRITESAAKDLSRLPVSVTERILRAIRRLENGLSGDIKKLQDRLPAFRLRVGDYRVLFDVEDDVIQIRRVLHRKDAYR